MKILIAYDGSDYSDLVLNDLQKAGLPDEAETVILTVGEAWDLPLTLDRVSSRSGKFVHPNVNLIKEHLTEVSGKAKIIADSAAEKIKKNFPAWDIETEVVCGNSAVELIKKSDEWVPDLMIVGSHGRSTLGRLLLGSVSQKVLHEARCPVRISRKNEYGENSNPRILVAVDGSPNAEAVVKTVAGRNWSKNTEIRLIAVDDPFSRPQVGYVSWNLEEDKPEDNEKTREWMDKVIGAPEEILKSTGLNVSHKIHWGDAANMILNEAEVWKADSIFVGARGLGRFKRILLGSVSSSIAAKAKCSVEVIR